MSLHCKARGRVTEELTLPLDGRSAPKWGLSKEIRTAKRSQVSSFIEILYKYSEMFLKVCFAMTKGWGDLERL